MLEEMPDSRKPLVGVVMGSRSDWETMQHACAILEQFNVAYEKRVTSAHRTPELMAEYGRTARARGLRVIIAGAGGAAHLPGMMAAHTTLPVLGVPVKGSSLDGLDSLLSIVQMPAGVPVSTFAIGRAGAVNAALTAVAILALSDPALADKLEAYRADLRATVEASVLPDIAASQS
jgi:5-(carboxyamino)imidazole ribonucleotide mutase